jgi:hypothetical protein
MRDGNERAGLTDWAMRQHIMGGSAIYVLILRTDREV